MMNIGMTASVQSDRLAADNFVNHVAAAYHDGDTDQQRHQQDWHDRLLLLFVPANQRSQWRAVAAQMFVMD